MLLLRPVFLSLALLVAPLAARADREAAAPAPAAPAPAAADPHGPSPAPAAPDPSTAAPAPSPSPAASTSAPVPAAGPAPGAVAGAPLPGPGSPLGLSASPVGSIDATLRLQLELPKPGLPPDGAADARSPERGFFLGEKYTWGEMGIFSRVFFDTVGIPLNVVTWDVWDWAQLVFWTALSGATWFGGDPSYDVQLDRWISTNVNPHLPMIWSVPMQSIFWPAVLVAGIGTWWWAGATGHTDIEQGLSLMAEALTVSQIYHVILKVAVGRNGPTDGDQLGGSYGPANAIAVYPAGWPSGHSATLFSLMSAGFAYFRPAWWIQAIGYATVGALGIAHVIDHRHYISEIVAGAAMGYYTGQWVVKHRASWLYGERQERFEVTVVPLVQRDATGLAVAGRF
jgi:membrane-associated phospholipid phosphatase